MGFSPGNPDSSHYPKKPIHVRLVGYSKSNKDKSEVIAALAAFGQGRSKSCPSPGELFHFAFAHESGTLTGTDVTQPSATDVLL